MKPLMDLFELGGRVFMAVIFLVAGYGKITGYAGTAAYMKSVGVPGGLLPLVIALELGGGLLIVAGFQTRIIAFLMSGFCLLAALLFHNHFDNQMQSIMFMKNVAMAGGFLFLVVHGAGTFSVDNMLKKGKSQA